LKRDGLKTLSSSAISTMNLKLIEFHDDVTAEGEFKLNICRFPPSLLG
jgi:hypothetical protein